MNLPGKPRDLAVSLNRLSYSNCQFPEYIGIWFATIFLMKQEIQRVYDENYSVYGVRKIWRQLPREGASVARCTIKADEEHGPERRAAE